MRLGAGGEMRLGAGGGMTVEVVPIQPSDLPRVAAYLNEHHRSHFTAEQWEKSGIATPWTSEFPNRGFMLVDGDQIGGVLIAMYSKRMVDGQEVDICNLSSWNVRPEYRLHSFRLLRAALSQEGYVFTDLTATEEVRKMNLRFGFEFVDNVTALIPNLPWPLLGGRTEMIDDPDAIEARLGGAALRYYRDHAHAIPAQHVVLSRGDRSCYVMFRRERRKKMPLFASLLYVSDPQAFRRMGRPFLRYLLLKHRIVATLIDTYIVDYRPFGSILLRGHRPKMIKTDGPAPEKIEALYLYSDLPGLPT